MRKHRTFRTLIELDEVYQNVEPGHFYVLRIFGIPIMRFNQSERHVEEDDDEEEE